MLRCVRCGTENLSSSQFCDECGRRLTNSDNLSAGRSRQQSSAKLTMTEENEASSDFREASGEGAAAAVSPDSLIGWRSNDKNNTAHSPQNVTKTIINSASAATTTTTTTAHARLIIERGKNSGKEFILREAEVNIGRWDADNGIFPDVDLDVDDPEAKVSRRHARIVRYGNQYLVEDLGSTNGTFINRGRRLLPGNQQIVEDGDEIIVGKTFLRFQVIR